MGHHVAHRQRPRWGARLALAAAIAVASQVAGLAPAAAHVTIEQVTANNDGTVTLTFSFDHGCGDSPTVELHVQLPDGVTTTATRQPAGWSAERLDGSLRWTGPPVAAGEAASYELTTPAFGRAGETVWFPVVQRCETGEYAWINTDPGAAEPAPFVVLDATTARDPAATPDPADSAGSGSGPTGTQLLAIIAAATAVSTALGVYFSPARRLSRIRDQ